MLDKLGGRKTLAFLLVMVAGLILAIVKGDIPEHFATFLEVAFGVFVTGNVGSKIAFKQEPVPGATESVETAAPTPVDHTDSLNNISGGLIAVQELLKLIIRRTQIDKLPEPPSNG